MKQYWLIKSEPDCYSIDDLAKEKKVSWTGVRNYQARNFIRAMKKGDSILFYHSSANPVLVAGIAEVGSDPYADTSALRKNEDHYDQKATKENPIWSAVDVVFIKKFKNPVTLNYIKLNPKLEGMMVSQKGSRLSVQPVSEAHFKIIKAIGEK